MYSTADLTLPSVLTLHRLLSDLIDPLRVKSATGGASIDHDDCLEWARPSRRVGVSARLSASSSSSKWSLIRIEAGVWERLACEGVAYPSLTLTKLWASSSASLSSCDGSGDDVERDRVVQWKGGVERASVGDANERLWGVARGVLASELAELRTEAAPSEFWRACDEKPDAMRRWRGRTVTKENGVFGSLTSGVTGGVRWRGLGWKPRTGETEGLVGEGFEKGPMSGEAGRTGADVDETRVASSLTADREGEVVPTDDETDCARGAVAAVSPTACKASESLDEMTRKTSCVANCMARTFSSSPGSSGVSHARRERAPSPASGELSWSGERGDKQGVWLRCEIESMRAATAW